MIEQRVFPNSPDAVAHARRYVTRLLENVPEEVRGSIGLMVSELATNCVRHTPSEFTVDVELTPEHICVTVTDKGPGEPVIRSPEPTEPSGRGLRLVRELADSFGIEYDPGARRDKSVWFIIRLDARLEVVTEEQHAAPGSIAGPAAASQVPSREADSKSPRAGRKGQSPPRLLTEARRSATGSRERRERFQSRYTCHAFLPANRVGTDSSHVARYGNPAIA